MRTTGFWALSPSIGQSVVYCTWVFRTFLTGKPSFLVNLGRVVIALANNSCALPKKDILESMPMLTTAQVDFHWRWKGSEPSSVHSCHYTCPPACGPFHCSIFPHCKLVHSCSHICNILAHMSPLKCGTQAHIFIGFCHFAWVHVYASFHYSAWLLYAFFSLRAPVPPPFAYPPSSAAPRCMFSLLSTTLLKHTFAPPSAAGSGTSTKWSSGATITSHVLFWDSPAHSILGLPAFHLTWWKKRNDYLTFSMFVLLTSICQYISEIVLFCWVQNSDSSASEYQTTGFLPFMGHDCICNQLPKLPNCWRLVSCCYGVMGWHGRDCVVEIL